MTTTETTYRNFNINRRQVEPRAGEDADLEALIDEAGRDEVFAYASANGWSMVNPPEKWVWRQMAYDVLRRKAEQNAAKS